MMISPEAGFGAALPENARLAVLGDPVAHSLSPSMQNAALRHLGVPYVYERLRVPLESLGVVFQQLRERQFLGWNLTLPLKVTALEYVDEVDPEALALGAINTVVHRGGRLYGYNTDGRGLLAALAEAFSLNLSQSRVAILGAGGGAGSAAARFLMRSGVQSLTLVNRTKSKVQLLSQELGPHSQVRDWTELDEVFRDCELIIHASSAGLDDKPLDWPLSWLRPEHRIFDMVYGPAETPIVRWAKTKQLPAVDGLGMLLHQGAFAFELWFGTPAPLWVMEQALYLAARRDRPSKRNRQ